MAAYGFMAIPAIVSYLIGICDMKNETHTLKLYTVIFSCTTKEQVHGARRYLDLWAIHNMRMARAYSTGKCMRRHYEIEDIVTDCLAFLNKI